MGNFKMAGCDAGAWNKMGTLEQNKCLPDTCMYILNIDFITYLFDA